MSPPIPYSTHPLQDFKYFFDFSLIIGDKILNRISGGSYPAIDLFNIQSYGFNLAIGNRWSFDKNKAIPGFEGLIIGNLAVQGLKYSIRRERPDRSENVSMPSGHTQASFSIASSFTEQYGWKKTCIFFIETLPFFKLFFLWPIVCLFIVRIAQANSKYRVNNLVRGINIYGCKFPISNW